MVRDVWISWLEERRNRLSVSFANCKVCLKKRCIVYTQLDNGVHWPLGSIRRIFPLTDSFTTQPNLPLILFLILSPSFYIVLGTNMFPGQITSHQGKFRGILWLANFGLELNIDHIKIVLKFECLLQKYQISALWHVKKSCLQSHDVHWN